MGGWRSTKKNWPALDKLVEYSALPLSGLEELS